MRGIGLASFLQVIHLERKTCTLVVTGGGSRGQLWLRNGELIHAQAGRVSGKEAFFLILDWPSPVLTVEDRCDALATIQEGVQQLLLEYYVREDHRRR